jgi:uncharacterized protein YkwD
MSTPVGDDQMDYGTRPAPPSARRVRLQASGLIVLVVLAAGCLYLARSVFSAQLPGSASGSLPAGVAVAVPPTVVTVPPRQLVVSPAASAHARPPSPGATGSVAGTASAAAPASAPASASTSAGQAGTAAAQVLALINQARATAGLPALTVTAGLDASSAAHNMRMADGCGLSHQCPGEAELGARETTAGVIWTAAGENIGDGGPVADTAAAIAQMAVSLTQSMLNEQPPDDGHRMNILSSTFTHIGIAVYRGSSGTVWLTQDFSN